jgi:hypothetical protein
MEMLVPDKISSSIYPFFYKHAFVLVIISNLQRNSFYDLTKLNLNSKLKILNN